MTDHTATVRALRAHTYDDIPYGVGQTYECALAHVEPLELTGNIERVEPAPAPPAPSAPRPRKKSPPS